MAFFSLDGVDGAGKSTQLALLAQWLRSQEHAVTVCRDPGSTPLGEAIREILLHREDTPIDARSEMLLYMAARAQLVEEIIRPALDAGQTVLSDRFLLANVVYQAHAGGLDVEATWRVGAVATGGLTPDLTIVLDLPVEVAAQRRDAKPDRMEARGDSFLQRVRDGFLAEAERRSDICVIDAARDPDSVQEDIRAAIQRHNALR